MSEYWASFWEHVDDLRQTLLRSLIIIGIGFILLLGFYQPIFQLLTDHSLKSIQPHLLQQKIQRIEIFNPSTESQLFKAPLHASIVSKISSFHKDQEEYYLIAPGETFVYDEKTPSSLLIMGPIEGLVLVMKICFWLSLALTAPLWGWVCFQFILPGLKESERRIFFPFLLYSVISLSMGIFFAYSITLPLANQYLVSFNDSIGQNAWTLSHYIDYVLLLYLGHAIAAELGLLLFLLVHFRFFTPVQLIAMRRYMIVLVFILAALLTPPDVATQLILALPLIALYEIAICYAKWRYKAFSKT